ncbi:MAG: hypothetical protein GY845_04375 [Planctomycetes bacterium]|nr:hypothetical protein [Planctomycetota bacterium]
MIKKIAAHIVGKHNTPKLRRGAFRTLRAIKNPDLMFRHKTAVDIFCSASSQVFFGYYDISPFSANNRYLLANHAPLKNKTPAPNDEVTLGYYDLLAGTKKFVAIGQSSTWCWQMGSRLQWYPANNYEQVIYNRLIDNKYGCVVQNIHTQKILRTYSKPLYCISHDGKWGLSIDFSRLQRLRPGYGYTTLPDTSAEQDRPNDNGIWRVDLETGDVEFLFSLCDIARLEPKRSMEDGEHYFNHICFNPNGTRFMFFHMCENNGARTSRLLTASIAGDNMAVLENERFISHYTWKTISEILATTFDTDTGFEYRLYKDISGESHLMGKNVLKGDGHPSYFPNQNRILADTYPDKYGYYDIIVYDGEMNTVSQVTTFYVPINFSAGHSGEVRCDLHPRLDSNGKNICADIVHKGKRAMITTSVENTDEN